MYRTALELARLHHNQNCVELLNDTPGDETNEEDNKDKPKKQERLSALAKGFNSSPFGSGAKKTTATFGTAKAAGTFGTAKATSTFGTAKATTDKLDNKGITKPSPNTSVRNGQGPKTLENKSVPQIDNSSNPIETAINSAFPDATADQRKQLLAQFSMIYPYNYGMCNPMCNPMQMPMYQFGFPFNGIYFVPSFEHSIMIPGNGFTTRPTIWVPFIPYNYQQYKSFQQCTTPK